MQPNKHRFTAGTNMPGHMPDTEPTEFDNLESAKRWLIECIKIEEECAGTEDEAEELAAFAEDVNLQNNEFSAQCLGKVYWVKTNAT